MGGVYSEPKSTLNDCVFSCQFVLFLKKNLLKFKSILEAFIWGSVLGIRGKSPSSVEQEKRFWTTSVDTPYSISLKPVFLRQLSQATGKVRVREGVLSKTLTHGTYML